jgi:hypothetical protein
MLHLRSLFVRSMEAKMRAVPRWFMAGDSDQSDADDEPSCRSANPAALTGWRGNLPQNVGTRQTT